MNAIAIWLNGMAEPNRVALIRALATGQKHVTELAKIVGSEVVNVSHHLGKMTQAGLVQSEKSGRFVHYSLKDATIKGEILTLRHAESNTSVSFDVS